MLHALSSQVAQFGGDEELLPLYSALSDYGLDGVAEWDLVVVETGSVDVTACAQLQPLPQQVGQQFLVPEFVGAEALQLKHLLIGQRLERWTLLLLALLLSHVSYIFMSRGAKQNRNSRSIKSYPPLVGIEKDLLFFGLVMQEAQLHFPELFLCCLHLSFELGLSGA